MVKIIKSFDDIRPNMFDAVKRAFIFKRGVVARPRPAAEAKPAEDKPAPKQPPAEKPPQAQDSTESQPKESGESYPEKVAAGESDENIEKDDDSKDKLKSEIEGSKTAKGPEDLIEITEKSQDILFEATTVWPFTLFPDTITLDREKLTIANRTFWRVATITSVPVGEIMSAEATVGPFFGSLDLTFRFFANNERKIKFLTRQDATQMQRLIHGYIIAHRRELDVSSVEKDELCKLLAELGQGASD